MSQQQSAINLLRSQFQQAHHGWLEGTVQGVTNDQAHWQPPGRSAPIGAQYAHVLAAADFLLLGMVGGQPPLGLTSFAGKMGISELPPLGAWIDWARRVQVDMDALHAYAQAVYAAVDDYLTTLNDDDLARPVDLSEAGLGQHTLGSFATTILVHVTAHTGEISVIKGLQDLQGYAF